jgi:hypothetical protein
MFLIAAAVLPVRGTLNIEQKQDSNIVSSEDEYIVNLTYFGDLNGYIWDGHGDIRSIVDEEEGIAEIHIHIPDFIICRWMYYECRFLPILPEITTILTTLCCPPDPPIPDPYDDWLKNPYDLTKGNFTAINRMNFYLNDTHTGNIDAYFIVQPAGNNEFWANVEIYGDVYPVPPAELSTPEGYEMLLHQDGPGVLSGSYSQNLTAPNNTYFNYSVERTYYYNTDEQLLCDEICIFEWEYIETSEDDLMAMAYGHYESAAVLSIGNVKGGIGRVSAEVTNTGRMAIPEDFLQVNISFENAWMFMGKKTEHLCDVPIPIDEPIKVKSDFILGLGLAKIIIEVVFQDPEGKFRMIDRAEVNGFVLLPFVIIF